MTDIVFKKDKLAAYRLVSEESIEAIREYAYKVGFDTISESLFLTIGKVDNEVNWRDYERKCNRLKVTVEGLVTTEDGIAIKTKTYNYLNETANDYDESLYDGLIYLTDCIDKTRKIDFNRPFEGRITLLPESYSTEFPLLEQREIEVIIPEGVDPSLWEYLTPEQKRLW